MNKAIFEFTRSKNSFSVHVQNLEKLSVEQIKQIEDFVYKRNGVFDFNTYSFVIQKKIEFNEFVSLLKYSNLEANCKEIIKVASTTKRVEFGKYKGMLFSELPDSYLLWLRKNYSGSQRELIDNELKSRNI